MIPTEPGAPASRAAEEAPILAPGHTFGSITDAIAGIPLEKRRERAFIAGFAVAFSLFLLLLWALGTLVVRGIGIWGVNRPVGWGFAIINFVWWIGIGHAGTLISAILLLLRQSWRRSINRFAEAMTLFAVACAAIFPIFHLGRVWLFYWLVPYPNTMALWPNFKSPLEFDVFAVTTYAVVSALFWFMGMVPDLATLRDRATSRLARIAYGVLALGWRGSARHWHHYETAYLLLAGLATPLVLSVHTIVSFDFALAQVPGWHATIFPPYFVAGAIYAGFAMVLTLAIPMRAFYGLRDFITDRHLDNMAKVMLATGLFIAYGYALELFTAWYSGDPGEAFTMKNRMTGPYAPLFWLLWVFNVGIPQALWSRRVRNNRALLFAIALSVNVGMWLERFVIIVISLHRDQLPSSWGMYSPTRWDIATFAGTVGLFFTLFFLFLRFLPLISIFEVRALLPEATARDSRPSSPEGEPS